MAQTDDMTKYSVWIWTEDLKKVKTIAKDIGTSPADFIRMAIRARIKEYDLEQVRKDPPRK